jgi:very-short-patch-repair endonuclease
MKREVIQSLTNNFEDHSQTTESGIEFWFARDIQHLLGYTEWRNFEGVIKRAVQIIVNTQSEGIIQKTTKNVKIGSGAIRGVKDYKIDENGFILIRKLSASQKLNNAFEIRNETIFLQLIQKYCSKLSIKFEYQYKLHNYRFDCKIGENLLIEFDEPHHSYSTSQKRIDIDKNKIASDNNFKIFRIDLDMDIIDVIVIIQNNI